MGERGSEVITPYYPERLAECGDILEDGYRDTEELSVGEWPTALGIKTDDRL